MDFENKIIKLLKKETKLNNIKLEVPPNPDFGDYAYPCFELAKKNKKNPSEIAILFSKKIKKPNFLTNIQARGPYLNFFIKKDLIVKKTLMNIFEEKDKYGSNKEGKGKKALIEHTSINPNASPHVGRARNAMIGDSLARLLRFQGYNTEVHYFVNDIGKQIAILAEHTKNKKKLKFENLLEEYIKANKKIKEGSKEEEKIFELLKKLESGDEKTKKVFKRVVDVCINGQTTLFEKLDIKYDFFDYESKYLWSKELKEILKNYEKKKKTFKDEFERTVLDQKEFNLPMKAPFLVLTRKDGTSLYPLRDIAYHIDKSKKGKDLNLIVLGEDHKLYFEQLKAALSVLDVEAPKSIHYSFVLLKEGKMSTRKGTVVLLADFMDQAVEKAKKEIKRREKRINKKDLEKISKIIGYGALKYSILKVSSQKNVNFDWENALNFEGESAPYIQYSNARINSIIKKYKKKTSNKINFKLLNNKQEVEITKILAKFPKIVKESLDDLKPSLIANYVYELSNSFNEYYHAHQILKANEELKKARILFIYCIKQTIENALFLLGIDAPEKM